MIVMNFLCLIGLFYLSANHRIIIIDTKDAVSRVYPMRYNSKFARNDTWQDYMESNNRIAQEISAKSIPCIMICNAMSYIDVESLKVNEWTWQRGEAVAQNCASLLPTSNRRLAKILQKFSQQYNVHLRWRSPSFWSTFNLTLRTSK